MDPSATTAMSQPFRMAVRRGCSAPDSLPAGLYSTVTTDCALLGISHEYVCNCVYKDQQDAEIGHKPRLPWPDLRYGC